MKLLIIFAGILSAAIAKPIETEAEKLECVANYLRDEKLLDSSFEEFVQSEPIECEPYLAELRKDLLLATKNFKDSTSSGNNEENKNFKKAIAKNFECVEEQLNAIKYFEEVLKVVVYAKSKHTSKEKFIEDAKQNAAKKLAIASLTCFGESTFGELFDVLIKGDDKKEEDTIEGKQENYCGRKYVVDKNLIDTTKYTVNLNPDNIELNFECKEKLKKLFDSSEILLKDRIGIESKEITGCVDKTVSERKFFESLLKVGLLSEMTITADDKKAFRDEFVTKVKNSLIDLAKCD